MGSENPAEKLHNLTLAFAERLRQLGVCDQLMLTRQTNQVFVTVDASIAIADYSYRKASTPEVRQAREEYEKESAGIGAWLYVQIASHARFTEVLNRARGSGEDYVHYVLAREQLDVSTHST